MRTLNEVPRRLVIAIGGNAVHPEDISGTSEEQKAIARQTAEALVPLAQLDNELVITHGNGPVVGKIMMRQMLTMNRIPPMSMDICVAHSQGGIGYLLMQAMENALRERGNQRHVASLLTQVEVDANDPAFNNPTKFVGPFFSEEEAKRISAELDWKMREDSGRGWRHVVPSPKPKHVCDISLVDALAKRGTIVIAGGGGGMPVIRDERGVRTGVPAVIDKDLTSAHIANVLGIDELLSISANPTRKNSIRSRSTRSRSIIVKGISRRAAWDRKSMPQSGSSKAAASARSLVIWTVQCLPCVVKPAHTSCTKPHFCPHNN
jgi:carbamate kinase